MYPSSCLSGIVFCLSGIVFCLSIIVLIRFVHMNLYLLQVEADNCDTAILGGSGVILGRS